MKRLITICLVAGLIIAVSGTALADWDVDDGHKMHYPQLPDPEGWDVLASHNKILADDWQCSETGDVTDIHFWGSWQDDVIGLITNVRLSIHDNIPEDGEMPSMPGVSLWDWEFDSTQFTVRPYGEGDQGWYNPNTDVYTLSDHSLFHQINIEDIDEPFSQEKDMIYWLDISVTTIGGDQWGWKTSLDHFMDDAVWSDYGTPWEPLYDPATGVSLDMAFVITPEPATIGLLGLGSLFLIRRKRRA